MNKAKLTKPNLPRLWPKFLLTALSTVISLASESAIAIEYRAHGYRYAVWAMPNEVGASGDWAPSIAQACSDFKSRAKTLLSTAAYSSQNYVRPIGWQDANEGPEGCSSSYMVLICIHPTLPIPPGQACQIWSEPSAAAQVWVNEYERRTIVDLVLDKPPKCSVPAINPPSGNPIYPLTGVKRQEVDLDISLGGQSLSLSYDTRIKLPGAVHDGAQNRALHSFGPLWQSSFHKGMQLQSASNQAGTAYSSLMLQRGVSVRQSAGVSGFESCAGAGGGSSSGAYVVTGDPSQRITHTGNAAHLIDAQALVQENYNAAGAVLKVTRATGQTLTYTYSDASTPTSIAPEAGLLIQATDTFGRYVKFVYEQPSDTHLSPRIVTVTPSGGPAIRATYDVHGNLSSLTWADSSVRSFLYERADLPWALTGIIDESGQRHATYAYDNLGRAISTELAGGVNKYAVQYASPPAWSVTETSSGTTVCREHRWQAPTGTVLTTPSGQSNQMEATTQQGMVALTAQSQPAGSGCAASATAQSYDGKGNVKQFDSVNGNRTCYAHDLDRNLQSAKVEGLTSSADCSTVIAANATLPTGSRKVSIEWHPHWVLETRQAEPGKRTTSVYNGQPDPFNGNAIASCAPATRPAPRRQAHRRAVQAGRASHHRCQWRRGFSATLQSGVPNRQTTWTYNQWGQVLTEDGPRTDVSDITTYVYYTDATADHAIGDLKQVTNAAGKLTQYTKYNKHGQLLESTDANGVVTVHTYDLRQRLKSTAIGSQTTSYDYDAVGQLKKVSQPDGSWIGYDYDDAHRQTAVYDHLGNRIDYVLDNAGNRLARTPKTRVAHSSASSAEASTRSGAFNKLLAGSETRDIHG